ncbi:cyanophycin synthetase [Candidatus Gracilibacteria bacterium]|nr:cyanophycin synthetase [Candidatus Gracilibacteria bacterium]
MAEVAPDIGATVWLEPEYGFVGEITFSNGKKHLFRNTNFNVNPLGSVEIVRDKGYCSTFLKRYGYQVAEGKTFFREDLNEHISIKRGINEGWEYIKSLGLPVIVKPNNLSQGSGVQRVDSENEYHIAANAIFEKTNVMIIERLHIGQDYRVVVFNNEIISAYTRIPLTIRGNGIMTIWQLLQLKQQKFIEEGRDTIIDFEDPRIQRKLIKQGLTFDSVLDDNQDIFLLDNANLSTGGESIDVTEDIHPDFASLAKRITKDMGLRLCGVDFMTGDITKPLIENLDYIVIELNGAPGLDNYMSSGEKQLENVKTMYRKILLVLSEMN